MSEFREYIVGKDYSHLPYEENPYINDFMRKYAKSGDTYLYLGSNIYHYALPDGTKIYYAKFGHLSTPEDYIIHGLVKDTYTPVPPREPFGNTTYPDNTTHKDNTTYRDIFNNNLNSIIEVADKTPNYRKKYDITIEERDGEEYYKCTLIVPKKEGGRSKLGRSKRRGGNKRSKKNKRRSQRRQRRR